MFMFSDKWKFCFPERNNENKKQVHIKRGLGEVYIELERGKKYHRPEDKMGIRKRDRDKKVKLIL